MAKGTNKSICYYMPLHPYNSTVNTFGLPAQLNRKRGVKKINKQIKIKQTLVMLKLEFQNNQTVLKKMSINKPSFSCCYS